MSYYGQERYNGSLYQQNRPKPKPISREEQLRLIEEGIKAGKLRRCKPLSQVPTLTFEEALAVLRAAGATIYERKRGKALTYSLDSTKMTPNDSMIDAARNLIGVGRVTWPLEQKDAA